MIFQSTQKLRSWMYFISSATHSSKLISLRWGCDLPVAAQSGGDVQPLALVVAVQLYLPGQCGARPHDAHIALQHVEQLWQLVQTGLAQEMTHAGDILVRVVQQMVGISWGVSMRMVRNFKM